MTGQCVVSYVHDYGWFIGIQLADSEYLYKTSSMTENI